MAIRYFSEFGRLPVVTAYASSPDELISDLKARPINIYLSRNGKGYVSHLDPKHVREFISNPFIVPTSQTMTPRFEKWFWVISCEFPASVSFGYSNTAKIESFWEKQSQMPHTLMSIWPIIMPNFSKTEQIPKTKANQLESA